MQYPYTRRCDQVDDYHGIQVADPYRWLEDTDSAETQAWIAAQNELTFGYLSHIPERAAIRARLAASWDLERRSAPVPRGGRYFQFRNSGLQNQDVLVVSESLASDARVLLDPNTLSEDGTIALNEWAVSQDGRWLAYAVSSRGSDWQTWRVRNVAGGEDLSDRLEWSKFSPAAWLPDGSGFYYARYSEPLTDQEYESINEGQRLYFHRLGTAQAEDVLVYARPDQPTWGFLPIVTEDGRYLVLQVWRGKDVRNRIFYRDLAQGGPFVELIPDLEANYTFIEAHGPVFYFRSDHTAPCGCVIAIDTAHPERHAWRTVIPEVGDTLDYVKLIGNTLAALYLHDAYHQLKLFGLDGSAQGDIALPGPGSLVASHELLLAGQRDGSEFFYAFNSYLTQRPDLFGAALPAVGVMDMLRFQRFTIGWAWVSEYGSAADPAQFPAVYAYSPLHNIRSATAYPATFITTADHDDRVVPGHSFKFAAALQAAQAGSAPILIRVQVKAGHGFGKPTALIIEEQADILAFLMHNLLAG